MAIIPVFSIVLIVLFYGTYFAKQILLARQNIVFMRLGRGEKPLRTWRIEIIVMVLNWLMPIAMVGFMIFGENMPHLRPILLFGVVVQLVGVIYFIAAIVAMRTSWRAGIDETQQTTLITQGIYRMSRNPAFVGFDLLYIGTTLVFPTLILLILTPITIVAFHLIILEEEKYLSNRFGNEYARYKEATLRY